MLTLTVEKIAMYNVAKKVLQGISNFAIEYKSPFGVDNQQLGSI